MSCNWASSLEDGGGGAQGPSSQSIPTLDRDHCMTALEPGSMDTFVMNNLISSAEVNPAMFDKVVGFQEAITSFANQPEVLFKTPGTPTTEGGGISKCGEDLSDPTFYEFQTSGSPTSASGATSSPQNVCEVGGADNSNSTLCLAQPLAPGTGIYPGPPIAFVDPRGPHEVYNRVPLGEKGRMELKAAIRQALKNRPELREKVNAVAKLRCATIPQLLRIAAICDLWFMALNISRRFVETRTGKHKRRPPSLNCASGGGNSSPDLSKTRAKSKFMKHHDAGSATASLSPMIQAAAEEAALIPEAHRALARCGDPPKNPPCIAGVGGPPQPPAPADTLDPTGWGMDWDPSLVGDTLFGTYF